MTKTQTATTAGPNDSGDKDTRTDTLPLKFLGMEIPLPHWAVSVLAVFVVIFFPVFVFVSIRHMQQDDKDKAELNQVQQNLSSAKRDLAQEQAKERAAEDAYTEIMKHSNEKGDWHYPLKNDSNVIVTHYASDGCISILHPGQGQPQFIKDPARNPQPPAPGATDGQISQQQMPPALVHKTGGSTAIAQLQLIDLNIASPGNVPALRAVVLNGKCLNPHPGNYVSSSGRVQGCWKQIWRKWPDGCTHYQWFNTCTSVWDAAPNGAPRIYWTACNH